MERLLTVIALCLLSVSLYAVQAQRLGPTLIDVPNGGNVDAVTVDQNDQGEYAVNVSSGFVIFWGQTLAQINKLAAPDIGAVIRCTNCTRTTHCVSSSTVAGGWVVFTATGAFVGADYAGFAHCE